MTTCGLIDTGRLAGVAEQAAAALAFFGGSLGAGDDEARLEVLEQAGEVILACRRLSQAADGLLATGPPSDEVRGVVETRAVSGLLEEIGEALVRMTAASGNAAAVLTPPDPGIVDALDDMAHLAARMTREAVAAFMLGRPDRAQELQVPAGRVGSGHRHVSETAAAFTHPHQREWGLWMVEISQELERVAALAVAVGEKAAPRAGLAG